VWSTQGRASGPLPSLSNTLSRSPSTRWNGVRVPNSLFWGGVDVDDNAPMGTLGALVLAFDPPPMAALAPAVASVPLVVSSLVVHVVEVNGGS
jgi:hypothetical protein